MRKPETGDLFRRASAAVPAGSPERKRVEFFREGYRYAELVQAAIVASLRAARGEIPARALGVRGRTAQRNLELRVYISAADSFRGPYRVANDNVWPHARLEDFFLFKHEGRYHLICEDARASITGHTKWGGHLTSRDGIHDWRPHEPATVYDHTIRWTDGTALQAARRERPWLLFEDGRATHLFTSVYDGTATWNQPVPLRPAWPIGP